MSDSPTVMITGAARGIGAATAVEFASRGYRVALVDLDESGLVAVSEQVRQLGGDALAIAGDLVDLTFAEAAVGRAAECFGRLDVLVNNAAWREIVTMRQIAVSSWEKTLRICLTTPAFLARWAAERMQPRGSGVIVNVSSMMSQQAAGIGPAYVACKGALDSLTYELASLYGPHGIRVVAVNPGAIDTELSRDYPQGGGTADDPLRQFSEEMIMLRRWGQPEEIARVIAWLASSEASYITGTTLVVDGGWQHQHFSHSLKQRQFPQEFTR
ncbi:MAG: SDR family oxidoreductase [Pirellulales bacterium]|nr:SDR family oxidoreductase [Pirellulales bacterium]